MLINIPTFLTADFRGGFHSLFPSLFRSEKGSFDAKCGKQGMQKRRDLQGFRVFEGEKAALTSWRSQIRVLYRPSPKTPQNLVFCGVFSCPHRFPRRRRLGRKTISEGRNAVSA